MSKAMEYPRAGYGAGYKPDDHHFHDGIQDADIVKQLDSPVHGVRGITDESGTGETRNQYWLKDSEKRGNGDTKNTPDADKQEKHRPTVTDDDGPRGSQKANRA